MNEDLHIEKAAHLADKPGAENLATDRAKEFVAKTLAANENEDTPVSKSLFVRRPVFAWSGVALALAASVVVAVVLFRPASSGNGNDGILNGFGTPGQLLENQSIHAETEVLDSLKTESSDTLTIETIIKTDE